MIEYRVPLPNGGATLDEWVERLAAEEGVTARAMGTRRTVPGSRHWHLASGRRSGTVEITLDPRRQCFVVAVHENRRGSWTGDAAAVMAAKLRRWTGEV